MTGPTNGSTAPLPPPQQQPDEPTHGVPPRRTGPSRTAAHLVGGLLLLVVGMLWLLDAAGAVDLRWRAILPAGLVVVGVAVLVLSLWDRAGELVGVGVVLTVLVVASALLPDHLSAAIGERTHRPTTVTELRDHYSHGLGELTIDLRDVTDFTGDTTVGASLGVGELRVRVPPELTVVVDASAGIGEVTAFDRSSGGVAVELRESRRVDGGPVLRLELSAGIGEIEVTP